MNKCRDRCLAVVVTGCVVGLVLLANLALPAPSKKPGGHAAPKSSTVDDDHHHHGTPAGWKFSWPAGDPVKGRDIFVKLECYSCHEVNGEKFPAPGGEIGPELSSMGPLHEADFFAEAIINPSAVIDEGRGYEDADGASKMPSYNDLVTVQEVIDLVAYLKHLKPPAEPPGSRGRQSGAGGHRGRP